MNADAIASASLAPLLIGLVLAAWTVAAAAAILVARRRQRRAEGQLRQARRLARMIEESPAVPLLVRADGRIDGANLIIPTGQNLANIEEDMRTLVPQLLAQELSREEMTLRLEMLVRAYDPCLSCATHALGKMPLQVELYSHDGQLLSRVVKDSG